VSEFSPRHPVLKWVIGFAVIAIVGLVVWSMQGLFTGSKSKPKVPPKISLVPDRPPPPPPKPQEKPPEPPKNQQKEVKLNQPKEAPPTPQTESLKMEGAAGNGPSAFQSGSVGNEDLSRVGTGDGGSGAFTTYAQVVKRRVEQYLSRNNALRGYPYKVEVRVWVSAAGAVSRTELVDSTGNSDLDSALRSVLKEMPALSEAPPNGMPQPVRLRLVSS
jgi:periplasmic protein TonB